MAISTMDKVKKHGQNLQVRAISRQAFRLVGHSGSAGASMDVPSVPDPHSPRSSQSPPPEELGAVHDELLGLAHGLYNLGMTVLEDLSKEKVGETGATVEKPVGARVNEVVQHLAAIDNLSHSVQTLIPWSVLVEIDNGKNPANLTRQHVERVSSENMWMNGKVDAILSYKSRLDAALMQHFPELVPHLQQANTHVDDSVKTESTEDTKPIITNGSNINSNGNGIHYGQPSR